MVPSTVNTLLPVSTTLGHCGVRATYQPTNTLSHPSSQLIPSHSTLRLTCGTSGPGDQRSHQRDDHGPAPPAPPAAPSPYRAQTRAAVNTQYYHSPSGKLSSIRCAARTTRRRDALCNYSSVAANRSCATHTGPIRS